MNLPFRSLLVLWCGGLLVGVSPTSAQTPSAERSGFSLKTDRASQQLLDALADHIQARKWDLVAQGLASVLDKAEPFAVVSRQGRVVGVHADAVRILKGLPPEGLAEYQKVREPAAAEALREAKDDDPEKLAWVILRHPLTESAQKAEGTLTRLRVRQKFELEQQTGKDDWLMFGGNATRTAHVQAGTPYLKARWQDELIRTKKGERLLGPILGQLNTSGTPHLPSACPVTIAVVRQQSTLLVYRSWRGIHAVDLATGRLAWEVASPWSIETMLYDPRKSVHELWWNLLTRGYQRWTAPLENTLVGTLSTDGRSVYTVEDFALPPLKNPVRRDEGQLFDSERLEPTFHNRLRAWDLATGKLKWEALADWKEDTQLEDSFFLGSPLPVAGRLWVLNEKDGELRLLGIEPATGKVLSLSPLGITGTPLYKDFLRRIHAAPLAASGNVLVCPTGTGSILGIDLLTSNLLWVHNYGDVPPREKNLTIPSSNVPIWWGPPAPRIDQGRVVFSSFDTQSIHCVQLKDGAPLWKKPRRADDLYLAGSFGGRVLIVGKSSCRSLDLADGDTLWETTTGEPSGFGAVAGDRFHLPLRRERKSNRPGVYSLDLKTGKVVSYLPSKDGEAPGNLIYHGEWVISQSPTTIAIFPQLEAQSRLLDNLLQTSPNDPCVLLDRSELKHAQGDLRGAIGDIHKAREGELDRDLRKRSEELLYLAITDLLERDFAAGEKYLAEYEKLVTRPVDPALPANRQKEIEQENSSRLTRSLTLQARGKAGQGKHAEAIRLAMHPAFSPGDSDVYLELQDGVEVSPTVWVRQFVEKLHAGATPKGRKMLEEELARLWLDLEQLNDAEAMRRFVRFIGLSSATGREARLALAERLRRDKAYAEANLLLQAVRSQKADPRRAGRALAQLVEMMMEQGLFADALYHARILAREYAEAPIRENITGKDFFDRLAGDRHIVPLLNRDRGFPAGNYVASEEKTGNAAANVYEFGWIGEPLTSLESSALGFDLDGEKIQLRQGDKVAWSLPMPRTTMAGILAMKASSFELILHLNATAVGQVALVPVGQKTVAVDVPTGKALWELDRYHGPGNSSPALPHPVEMPIRNERDGSRLVSYVDGWQERVGTPLPISSELACIATRWGIVGVHVGSGKVQWKRTDLGPNCAIYGDDRHVLVIAYDTAREPIASHVLRLADGSRLDVPSCLDQFKRSIAVVGSRLLVKESTDQNIVLSLHEPATGKTLWKKDLPGGSVVLDSLAPGLTGWVESDGKTVVVDLTTLQTVHEGKVAPELFARVKRVFLLADDDNWHLAASDETSKQVTAVVITSRGMSVAPVHGQVCAIEKRRGKVLWSERVENQMLLLNRWRELPVLIFASGTIAQRTGQVVYIINAKVINKHDGKFIFGGELPADTVFHTLKVDRDRKEIELIAAETKLRIAVKSP